MSDADSDAEFERRYPRSRKGLPVWAVVFIVLGVFGGVGFVGMFIVGMFFGTSTRPPPGPVAMSTVEPPQVKEVFTRAEFERLVTGKTVAEVKAAVGEPPMSVGNDGEETWMYRQRTTDPATGRTDDFTDVQFRGGKVVWVGYREGPPPGGPGPAPGK